MSIQHAPQIERPKPSPIAVRATAGPFLQRKCSCGARSEDGETCPSCRRDQEKNVLRRSSLINASGPGSLAPPIVHEVLRSPGHALDESTRGHFESRFGRDFSAVRIHTGSRAAESAGAVEARAYTVGGHIVFGEGQYRPRSPEGRRMLAHELTHVAQQGGNLGVASGPIPLGGEGPAERDAESVAEALTGGGPATPSLRDDRPMLRRQGIGEAGGGCGACKPYELTGTDIHALLSGEFKKLGIKQSPISDPENVKDGVLDLLRVGIVPSIRGDTVVIEIGELKPNNFGQTKKGHRQLERYEAMLRRHLHELVPDSGIHPINISFDFLSDPPPPPAEYSDPSGPSCPKQTVIVSGPAYGLYLYHCKPSRKQIKDCCKQPGDPHPFPIPAIKSGEQPSEESAERETPSVGTEAIEQAARKHDVPEELIYAVMTAISIAILDPEPISKAITSLVALGLSATVAVLILIDLGFGADSPITTPTQSSSST